MVALGMKRMLPYADVVDAALREIGEHPDPSTWRIITSGSAHVVVGIDDRLCVRIAKNPAAKRSLARRTEVLSRLPEYSFATPRPLSRVHGSRGHGAVALSWVHGEHRWGRVDTAELISLLEQLWATDTAPLEAYLDRPGQHWGGHRRRRIMLDDVVPRLLPRNRDLARHAIRDLAELETVTPHLVHSDLMGQNMIWSGDALAGVIDWDHASLGDPAQDVAALACSYGWPTFDGALPPEILHRARLHARIMPMQSVAYTLVQDLDTAQVNQAVARADEWIDTRLRALLRR